jgi:hypothetical protein
MFKKLVAREDFFGLEEVEKFKVEFLERSIKFEAEYSEKALQHEIKTEISELSSKMDQAESTFKKGPPRVTID